MQKPAPSVEGSGKSEEEAEEAAVAQLATLAAQVVLAQRRNKSAEPVQGDCQRAIRKLLVQQQDDILYEALERCREHNREAGLWLRDAIEEASAVAVIRRDARSSVEVTAFVVPLFLHTTGGLDASRNFQDGAAFEALTASFTAAGLESPTARVVLVSHGYTLDQIERVSYSQLASMLREAGATMTSNKIAAAPALEASMGDWPASHFGAGDSAIELRFLLGFAMAPTDDPFYRAPQDEARLDAWFDARAQRFQAWSEEVAPLVLRCFGMQGVDDRVHFLYQDLFHGGKRTAANELATLEMMAQLNAGLEAQGAIAASTHAVLRVADAAAIRVLLQDAHGRTLVSAEKTLAADDDAGEHLADISDALDTMGVASIQLAPAQGSSE